MGRSTPDETTPSTVTISSPAPSWTALRSQMAKTTRAASGPAAVMAQRILVITTACPAANPDRHGTTHIPVAAAARRTCRAPVVTGSFTALLPTDLWSFCKAKRHYMVPDNFPVDAVAIARAERSTSKRIEQSILSHGGRCLHNTQKI